MRMSAPAMMRKSFPTARLRELWGEFFLVLDKKFFIELYIFKYDPSAAHDSTKGIRHHNDRKLQHLLKEMRDSRDEGAPS
jgi:hypothetical protein